jgi:O-antigen/teichoic acid export membrane protein
MEIELRQEGSSLTAQAFWLMLARTLAFAFSFALPLLLVRRLSQHDLGLYRQVFLIVLSATTVLPLGFHMSAFYFLPREPERQSQVVLNITLFFVLVAGLAAGVLSFRPTLLASIFNSPELGSLAPLISLVLFLWVATSYLEYLAMANQEMRLATIMIVVLTFTRTSLLLSAAVWFGSVRAILWGAVAQGLVQAAVLAVYLHSRFKPIAGGFGFDLLRRQLSYAIPLGFATLLYWMQLDTHNYFVSNVFGTATFAVYSIGCFQIPLIHILSDSVGSVMIPRVTHLESQNQHHDIIVLTARMMRKLALVYFALYALLLVVSREFVLVLFTERYLASRPIFVVNLTMILIYFMSSIYDPVMRAYAEHRFFLLRLRAVLLTTLLVALWFGTAKLGLVGVITLVVGINLIERVVVLGKAARIVGVRRQELVLFKDVAKLAGAATVAGAAAWGVRMLFGGLKPFVVLVVCSLAFVCVYALAIWLLKIVTPDELATLSRKFAGLTRVAWWRRDVEPVV